MSLEFLALQLKNAMYNVQATFKTNYDKNLRELKIFIKNRVHALFLICKF